MMLDSKMKDLCRICARELYGNQRRWIFHPTAKLSLQVLLSYALGKEMTRDGRGEFACSKCTFMLDRMYRFDTVIARVEALSVERMQKLLLEKDRLRQCIGGLYRKNNADDFGEDDGASDSPVVDFSKLTEVEYSALLQEDLTYSVYESWAEQGAQEQVQDHQCPHHQCHAAADASPCPRPRKCKGCAALRVADSDYEAVCKVPRKVGRSTSCGPSTRYSGSVQDNAEETVPSAPPPEPEPVENNQTRCPSDQEPFCLSPGSSVESLDTAVDLTQESHSKVHPNTMQGESEEEQSTIRRPESRPGSVCGLDIALSLLKSFEYHPLQSHRGSRIPVLLKPNATPMESPYPLLQVTPTGMECPLSPHLPDAPSSIQQELQLELAEMEDLWLDDYIQCKPSGLEKRLIEEQQCQLAEYENAAGQCVSELQKAQQQVQSLQTKIRESETSNKKLQQRLGDMESELRSVREAVCGQERTIQTLSDSLNTKDCEITDLHRLTEEQNELLHSLKQQNNHFQLQQQQVSGVAPSRLQADLLDLQGSLFSAQLELQGLQRAQQQGQRREDDLSRGAQRLQADLQGALQHHQEAETHNHDLLAALDRARFEVQQMEEKWRDEGRRSEKEVEEREKTIRELKTSLEHKEQLLLDYSELVDAQKEPAGNKDNLIFKLKQRIQERDRALEDLQVQLVEPSGLPLVEQLTQELQVLREKVEHHDATCVNHKQAVLDPLVPMETGHADFGGFTSDDGEEEDEDCSSEFADSAEDEERSKLTAQSLLSIQSCDQHTGLKGCQDAVAEGPGLTEVKLLVEQKRAVERELMELKSQLEKAGFSSLSQMRKAFFTLCSENEELKSMVKGRKPQNDGLKNTSDRSDGQLVEAFGTEPNVKDSVCLKSDLEQVQQESRELQERLMVSEATVQAQAEQLKDYRELLTETSVQQDNKQVQVDIQDLGYETCGRSENEAEREDTSSPEFDDLELCTSLSYRDGCSQWWGGPSSLTSGKTEHDVTYLQQLVEDMRGQLSRSQAQIRSLQAQTRDQTPVSTLRKVNWGLDNSEAQSTAEEDEGWQSSDGFGSLPRQPKQDRELQELVSRVTSLEEQLRKGKGQAEDGKAVNWPGKFDTLIQAQARELSHLRQRMREGRGVCHILTQHLGDTTKAFEELLRSNDIDYYMGQSFRDQLSQSISLAQRVSTKISGRDHSEVPDDKSGHELLAIRLSKELQQKDKLIESLRSKLDQQQPRTDTPTSSHALSVATDQSDRTSFVSEDHGSTNEDLELCSELDAASEYGHEEAARSATDSHNHRGSASLHPSNPPSITSSHSHQSSNTCPSMQCTPHRPMETQAQTGLSTVPLSSSISFSTSLHCPQMSSPPVFEPQTHPLRTCHPYGVGFSLAEVHQELQMLQKQLGNSEPASECYHGPQNKPLPVFPLGSHAQLDHSSLHPLSHHAFEQSPVRSRHTSPAMKSGSSLLESGAMWDMMYGQRPIRPGVYGDVSSGSSGYQSGHTGADLMEEHLREIRTLRQRLEDSIQTNDRLRHQLEERLASSTRNGGGAPTNIYIQGLDSVNQLSNEIRVLKEENHTLQDQLQQARTDGIKEMERLREAVLSGRGQLKQAELEAGRWADQCRRLQAQIREQAQAVLQLKQDKQNSLDNSTRLQHEVNVLQQQLSECQCLVHTLQCELQVYQRVCGTTECNTGYSTTFDLRERESKIHLLEQQLRERLDQCMPRLSARKQLFHDQSSSPPVRDTGFSSPASPAVELDDPKSSASDSPKSAAEDLEAEAPDGSFACRTGHHMIGHVDDFSALQQQLLEGKVVICKMEAALQSSTESHDLPEGYVRNLHASTTTLKQILEETSSLLRMFWRAALPSTEASAQQLKKEQSLRKEVVALRRKFSEQEQLLRDTMENLRTSSRTKDNMEQFIVNQLSRTRDVLKQARSNLEKNELKIASLGCTPLPSSFYSVSPTPSWSDRGEVSGASLKYASSLGWNFVTPHAQDQHKVTTASWPAQGSDRLQMSSRLSAAVSPFL
ncbi:myomegalin isoform X11 [Rhinichthys klamathensis goyatoka]|uniref:myomegalin isoform X11 n=1 Tax=Rhinichthys klamathensis goyatoka TaxID=3034132 RepID=UPI0024B62C66|nr:myomegalin isoform X11 [Rhinichthys klamathensis goyatoka]